jgi:hypothetical protein
MTYSSDAERGCGLLVLFVLVFCIGVVAGFAAAVWTSGVWY